MEKQRSVILMWALMLGVLQVGAQDPLEITIEECKAKQQGWFFCTPEVQLDAAVQAMRRKGFCCDKNALSNYSKNNLAKCTQSNSPLRGVQCTQTVPEKWRPAEGALFNTYSLGMVYDRTTACPTLLDRKPLDPYVYL